MHPHLAAALGYLAAASVVLVVGWLCRVLLRAARGGRKGMRGFGAALMLFGWGHMRDPRNDTVAEASEGHAQRGSAAADGGGDTPR